MRVKNKVLGQVQGVVILDDTPHLNIRKGECLRHDLQPFCLRNRLVERLPFEIGDGPIRPYGSPVDVHNVVAIFLEERNLYIRIFASLLGENLDPKVVILMGGAAAIVAVYLAVQNNSWRARGLRLTGHLELFRRDGLEFARFDGNRVMGAYAQNKKERTG